MEIDDLQPPTFLPFQLQFDKPIASQVKIAEWNPEKDLLAMVTEDSKILLHRFNWQRLWTVSPGRCITSLCWRPDGKAIAVGLEDGSISLHDVENGKLLRSTKSHSSAVVCLNWEEDVLQSEDSSRNAFTYEDRTSRFFPSAPRMPQLPGLGSVDANFMDSADESYRELSNSSYHRFNILCSGDKDGSICFSIFGIFPIGRINVHKFTVRSSESGKETMCQLVNATIYKVSLSKNLCEVVVLCSGKLRRQIADVNDGSLQNEDSLIGLHSLCLETSIFRNRKNELHQVAQQATNIEDLMEVIRASLSLMHKQWCAAMHTYCDKFGALIPLIIDHGLDSTSQEEFMSLLGGARTSPPVHQFLVNSLGEAGLKRVTKAVDSASRELHLIVREHLQPAVEIIAFRFGELKGLSRWRARYHSIGLDEKLTDDATEKAGMLLVQVERFLRVLAGVSYQFQNFFAWLARCIKSLMSEPADLLPSYNSELVVIFLKFLYDQDPVKQLLENSEVIEIDLDTMRRIEELVKFGGFTDIEYLRRSLAREFEQMCESFNKAFLMPSMTVSKKVSCQDIQPLCPISSAASLSYFPASTSFYKDVLDSQSILLDYICFRYPDDSHTDMPSRIAIMRGFSLSLKHINDRASYLEVVVLHIPYGYECVDLSLYKESQVVILLNETSAFDSPGKAWLMIVEMSDLPFISISREYTRNPWMFDQLKGAAVNLHMESGKARCIPHSVTVPLAVSASRGVACVFATRKRALVYILEEDEDDISDLE